MAPEELDDSPDSADAEDDQVEPGEEGLRDDATAPIDLTPQWNEGTATIDVAGTYVLSADVHASEPLVVELPAGASATVDFAGHSAIVTSSDKPAVDVSKNSGSVTILDSTYNEDGSLDLGSAEAEPHSSLVLESNDPTHDAAAVYAVRDEGLREADSHAQFENLIVKADVKVSDAESYGYALSVVKTGVVQEDNEDAEQAVARVSFNSCVLMVHSTVDEESQALSEARVNGAQRGAVKTIDARNKGVALDGRMRFETQIDGEGLASAGGVLASVFERSYTLGASFQVPESEGEEAAQAERLLAFGFPESVQIEGADEAVVAELAGGADGLQDTFDTLVASEGFQAQPVYPPEGEDSPALLKVVRLPQALAENASSAEGDASDDADEAESAQGHAAVEEQSGEAAGAAGSAKPDGAGGGAAPSKASEQPASGGGSYAAYLAAQNEAAAQVEQLGAQASSVDLNASWTDTESDYTITSAGTYYLSANMDTEGALVIDAPQGDVVLKLGGYELTLDGTGPAAQKAMITINAARSVLIDGASASGASAIKSAGEMDVWGVSSVADGCALSMNDVSITLSSKTAAQRNLATHVVRVASGSLSCTNCTLSMLMGNQSLSSEGLVNGAIEVPSAVYALSGVEDVTLTDCVVVGEGTQGFGCELNSTDTLGNVYAVYSLAKTTTVGGGTYKAVSLRGNATCLSGTALKVVPGSNGNGVTLEADAGQLASGILATAAESVALDAPLSFAPGEEYAGFAQVDAALRSQVDNGFTFGNCAPQSEGATYPVLIMHAGDDLTSANADGYAVGSLGSQAESVLAALSNAVGNGCTLENLMGVARFSFKDEGLSVAVVSDPEKGDTPYSTLADALNEFSNGQTLTLLTDAPDITLSQVSDATFDLNGHSVATLELSSTAQGAGLVVKNGSVNSTKMVNGSRVAIYQNSAAPLVLRNVNVAAQGADTVVYGIYAANDTGAISLDGTSSINASVNCTSNSSSAYGIGMPSSGTGPAITLEGATIRVSTASADANVYGVSCTNGITINGGSLFIRGATGTAGAVYGGGALALKDAVLDVYRTGSSSSAYGFGVWGRSSNPVATGVTIDSCTVRVRSEANTSGLACACLLGATTATGTSTTPWTLSGECAFVTTSGMHAGFGLPDITVTGDFALSSNSDPVLLISQSQRSGNVAANVEGSVSADQLNALAALFQASANSYYEGWVPVADDALGKIVWSQGGSEDGAVSVLRNGVEGARYATFAEALAAAEAGDTLRLNTDVAEQGAFTVKQNSLTINMNGHKLALRAGGVNARSTGVYDALAFEGAGKLAVENGTIELNLGVASELARAATVPYEGLSVTGGGTLRIAADATVNVNYAGGTSSSAVQRAVTLRGVKVKDGSLVHDGVLNVVGCQVESGIGALNVYGILSDSTAKDAVQISADAQVNVTTSSAPLATKNAYNAETTYNATTNDGPTGLRELSVNPERDAVFYQTIVRQFQEHATYDDPDDTVTRTALNLGVYYVHNMALQAEPLEDGTTPWYDGLRIWAYTDVVPTDKVGNLTSVVPTHIFTSAAYEALPNAYGVATSADAAETASVVVQGTVSVTCQNGNAYALDADGKALWACTGATLNATSDDKAHPVNAGEFDLRDYISFSTDQDKKVVFEGTKAAKTVKLQSAVARDVVVGPDSAFTVDGAVSFAATGLDSATMQASSFNVGKAFSLAGGSSEQVCTVASSTGRNEAGTTFARGAAADQASLFKDAYLECSVEQSGSGDGLAWANANGYTVTFKMGDAVVKRYDSSVKTINLAEPTAAAKRAADQRQAYTVIGWSLDPDENATSGYEPVAGSVKPTGEATYYAVYDTGLVGDVPLVFTNLHDESGQPLDDVVLKARYGQTVTQAIESTQGASLPQPADYVDEQSGVVYRFAGWFPYSTATSWGPLLYDDEKLGELEITLSVNGVSNKGLVLRAVYLATQPTQHIVKFKVDGFVSACVVDDGARPVYKDANQTNTNYVFPAKQVTEAGKSFTFNQWFVDANGNGACDEGEAAYPAVLPRATADATYVADWNWEWSDVTLTFYVKYVDKDTGNLVSSGVRVIKATYEKKTQDVADGIVKIGDVFGYGGKKYTFEGWTVRKTDLEPVYNADNPLPTVNGDDRALSSDYAKTFYGVYTVVDHTVDVTFFDSDGTTQIGTAKNVVAISTSVDKAFTATKASAPKDRSEKESFLGWATSASATTALNGTSTMVEDLVDYADSTLSLYAVYGNLPTYTVYLRSTDGKQVLYQVPVKKGRSVMSVLSEKGIPISVSRQAGKYLAGWYAAGGKYVSLSDPVTGSTNLYAKYGTVNVDASKAKGVTAQVTLNDTLFSTLGLEDEVTGVSLSIESRSTPDTLLHSSVSKYGYTVLQSYTMKLVATYASGETAVQQGDVGTLKLSLPLDSKYKDGKPRVFWLGLDKGNEAAKLSSVKTISDEGTISTNIGNYEVGDEDEGGNLCIAYKEGGAGEGSATQRDKSSSSSSSSKSSSSSSSGGKGASSDDNGGTDSNTTGDDSVISGPSDGTTPSGNVSTLSSGISTRPSSITTASRTGVSGAKAESGVAGAAASARVNAGADSAKGGSSPNGGADGGVTGADGEGELAGEGASPFEGWDSDAVVLIVLALIALAALLYGLWRLIVVRQKRNEEEAELPSIDDRYANGVTF